MTSEMAKAQAPGRPVVYYDGACPLCSAEIATYRRRRGAERLAWIDVSADADAGQLCGDLTREQALARFHVRDRTGRLVSGGAAFAVLWSELPAFAWLGRLFRLRLPARLLDVAYDAFLKRRSAFQRLSKRRLAGFSSIR